MSTAPDIPYTDRNVREDPTLMQWAYEYLRTYGGSFEPLVNAQELLAAEGGLPSHLVRTVLNCMRHDANIAMHMPTPTPYITSIPAFTTRKKRTNYNEYVDCGNTESHSWHSHKVNDEYFQCKGIPFAINRSYYSLPATVKTPYARARTGKLWHHVAPGKNNGDILWYPNHHDYGFMYDIGPVLTVKLICKYPSYIRQPILMKNRPDTPLENQNLIIVEECPHCRAVLDTPMELRA